MAIIANVITLTYTIMFVAVFLIVHVATYPLRLAERVCKKTHAKLRSWRRNSFLGVKA